MIAWREEGHKKGWLMFKDHLCQAQEEHHNEEEVRQKWQEAYMDEQGAPGETQKGSQKRWTQKQVAWEEYKNCPSSQGSC